MELWANLVDYEKSDPLSSLDPNSVVSRVAFLFRRYLACFGHFPGVWHEAAMYCASAASAAQARGDDKSYALWAAETKNTFRRALKVLPESFLLSFAFADYLEGLAEDGVSQAKQVYIDLIAVSDGSLVGRGRKPSAVSQPLFERDRLSLVHYLPATLFLPATKHRPRQTLSNTPSRRWRALTCIAVPRGRAATSHRPHARLRAVHPPRPPDKRHQRGPGGV